MQKCAGDTSCSQRNCNDYDKCCLKCSKLATGCNKACKSLEETPYPYFVGDYGKELILNEEENKKEIEAIKKRNGFFTGYKCHKYFKEVND